MGGTNANWMTFPSLFPRPDFVSKADFFFSDFDCLRGGSMSTGAWFLRDEVHVATLPKSHHFGVLFEDQKSAPDLKITHFLNLRFQYFEDL